MQACFVLVVVVGIACASRSDSHVLMSFGLVADNHYDTFPAGEKAPWQPMDHWMKEQVRRTTTTTKRRYDVARDKMIEAINVFNSVMNLTFVVNLGDLVNNDLMWNLKPILDAFNAATPPHFSLLGNHDLRAHNDRFGKNNKTQERFLMRKLGLQKWFYSIDCPPFVLLFIDSMVMEPESTNRTAKQEHMNWMVSQLELARTNKRAVIVFAHIPIGFSTSVMGQTLRSFEHVTAAFFGHDHRGGYILQNNVHCVTLQGQIETLTNAFAVVEVFADRMELTGFGRVPTRTLPFTAATTALIRSAVAEDGPNASLERRAVVAAAPYQPLPSQLLWSDEALQAVPHLYLNIPNYKKPRLQNAEPNPGSTRFLSEYKAWPRRAHVTATEDPVDLQSALQGHDNYLPVPSRVRDVQVETSQVHAVPHLSEGSSNGRASFAPLHELQTVTVISCVCVVTTITVVVRRYRGMLCRRTASRTII